MRSHSPVPLSAIALLFAITGAQAEGGRHPERRRALPPVSGTLHLAPDEFGRARPRAQRQFVSRPETVRIVRGGLDPRVTDYRAITPAERWATGGTGVSGLIGNTGNPYGGETRWGTADSATTGNGGAPRFGWRRRGLFTAEPALADTYGEPPVYAGVSYGGPAYEGAPQLPFYGSGTPYTMSYYSSGSSAGPYGSPGGLATYRSGSYGYGPRVIETGAGYGYGYRRQGCTCGPRIVHLRRHHHLYSER